MASISDAPKRNRARYAGKLNRGISDEGSRVLLKRLNPLGVSRKPMRSAPEASKGAVGQPNHAGRRGIRGRTGEGLLAIRHTRGCAKT